MSVAGYVNLLQNVSTSRRRLYKSKVKSMKCILLRDHYVIICLHLSNRIFSPGFSDLTATKFEPNQDQSGTTCCNLNTIYTILIHKWWTNNNKTVITMIKFA